MRNSLQSDTSVLRRLGEGKLPYTAYERTLDVPILVYKHLCEHSTDAAHIRRWSIHLIKHLLYLSLWMQECCHNPEHVASLRQHEKQNAQELAHLSPLTKFFIRLRIYSARLVKRILRCLGK